MIFIINKYTHLIVDDDLAKIYILTSNDVLVKNSAASYPSPKSQYWTIRSYQEEPYGPVGIIQFNPPVSATWVAVFSENNARLALAEVEVYNSRVFFQILIQEIRYKLTHKIVPKLVTADQCLLLICI